MPSNTRISTNTNSFNYTQHFQLAITPVDRRMAGFCYLGLEDIQALTQRYGIGFVIQIS